MVPQAFGEHGVVSPSDHFRIEWVNRLHQGGALHSGPASSTRNSPGAQLPRCPSAPRTLLVEPVEIPPAGFVQVLLMLVPRQFFPAVHAVHPALFRGQRHSGRTLLADESGPGSVKGSSTAGPGFPGRVMRIHGLVGLERRRGPAARRSRSASADASSRLASSASRRASTE